MQQRIFSQKWQIKIAIKKKRKSSIEKGVLIH